MRYWPCLVLAALGIILACGRSDDEQSTTASHREPVEVEVELDTNPAMRFGSLADYQGNYMSLISYRSEFLSALNSELSNAGIAPSQVPEFFKLVVKFGPFDGCAPDSPWSYTLRCSRSFSSHIGIRAFAGPDELNVVGVPLYFSKLSQEHVFRRLRWAARDLVEQLTDTGVIAAIRLHTPYY